MRGKALWAILFIVPALIGGLVMAAVLLTPLPEPDNPQVTEILDASGRPVARMFTEDRIEIPVVRMPRHLLNAIVAIEDDRFYRHRGIDLIGIGRAFVRNLRAGKVLEGGSTLTQQLARNLSFGGQRLGLQRTLTRKLKEALLTLKLEYNYSKEQILGMYWNTIYLGRGAYGLERAAKLYFNKSVRDVPDGQPLDLTLVEAAELAALPQAPEYYSRIDDEDEAIRAKAAADLLNRRNQVLTRMAEQGYITVGEAEVARRTPLQLKPRRQAAEGAPYSAYVVDYITRELKERYPEVAANLPRGGYRIVTTIDRDLQEAAEAALQTGLKEIKTRLEEEPEIALVAMDPATGYIRALIGGKGPQVERNRALEPRQPGSTFKPVVYAAALSTRQYVASSTQLDVPKEYPGAQPGERWLVRNWENKSSNQPETMRAALKRSLNTVTVSWMDLLKPAPVIKLAEAMGLDGAYPDDLTIGLGTVAVSPLQMTVAYATLANGGYRVEPTAVLRVEDRDGNIYVDQQPSRTYALDAGVAFIVTDMLKEVLRKGGTGELGGAHLGGRPAAGKSGTTDESRDAWFVGYTPTLVASVWAGYDDRRKTELLGGWDISPIWGRFMSRALAQAPWRDWTPPPNVSAEEICTITKLRPNASCPVGKEWYLKGTAPVEIDSTVHWEQVVPPLPGVPWVPPGLLPPFMAPPGETPPEEGPLQPPPPNTSVPEPTEPTVEAPDAPAGEPLPFPPTE
ncbi:MAG: PBP1A family penicillin-binding protein [Bacillota bacterium]